MRAERHPWALHPPWGSHKLCSPLEGPPQGQVLAKPPCPPQGAGDSAWLCPHRQGTAGPRVPSRGMEAPRRGCCPALHGEERARTAQPSPAAAGENGAQATLPASGPENTGGKRCCLPLLSRSRSGYALLPSHASQTHKGNQLASFPWLRPTSFPPSRGLARGTFQLRLQTAAGTMEGAEAVARGWWPAAAWWLWRVRVPHEQGWEQETAQDFSAWPGRSPHGARLSRHFPSFWGGQENPVWPSRARPAVPEPHWWQRGTVPPCQGPLVAADSPCPISFLAPVLFRDSWLQLSGASCWDAAGTLLGRCWDAAGMLQGCSGPILWMAPSTSGMEAVGLRTWYK